MKTQKCILIKEAMSMIFKGNSDFEISTSVESDSVIRNKHKTIVFKFNKFRV